MPEGHTIHRLAKDLGSDLARLGPINASSPQGRFDAGAARIDGSELLRSDAYGKHLFCEWSGGEILHVHLGLIGKFRPSPLEQEPGDTIRLRLEGREVGWHLTGPQTCAVVSPDERDLVVARLGPDPLRRGSKRRDEFIERLRKTRRPVGAALLDQAIVAGIGNVYRAELLLLVGVHPDRPATDVDADTAGQLWDLTVKQLKRGMAWNRIVTVNSDDLGRRVTRSIDREDALYAYKRDGEPCRRCGTLIEISEVAGRSIWHCPQCQPK
jgi:endonuclease-8